ncbi:late control protein, partial [Bartonella sp. AP6QHHD]|uniref:late control protein n=2 Tax=unclassified Bartonella TaxID=2645622 RepID=UPI0035D04896
DIPLIGTIISVTLGYEGGKNRDMGAYLIDEISVSSPPQSLSVTGRAASMNTSYRTPKSQSYHQQTLGSIVQEIAERNGYTPKVDPSLAKIVMRHIDQTSESDMAFAARLAGEYDAVAKPVDGKLVLARRGEGKAITGETLPVIVIHEKHCTSWDFKYSARDESGAANGLETDVGDDQKAAADAREPEEIDDDENFIHMDDNDRAPSSESEKAEKESEKKEVKVGKAPFHELKYTYHNQSEAVAAIAAYRNKSSRGKSSFSCDIGGNPFVQAEAKLVQEPPFRPYIPAEWRIKSVKHKLDKTGGYTTKIECELFDASQEDAAGNVANTTPDKDDTLDPNAPPNASHDEGEGVIHMDEEDR